MEVPPLDLEKIKQLESSCPPPPPSPVELTSQYPHVQIILPPPPSPMESPTSTTQI